MSTQAQELMTNLNAIYDAIEHERDEDAARSKTLSVFGDWTQGTYGSGPDTDLSIICPRTTDGTAALECNHRRLADFLANAGESQDVMVFTATLEYARKGMPINLEAFTPPLVTIRPLGERTVYVFDKDTMYKQQCILKDIYNPHGQLICAVSTTNKAAVLPLDAFTSRPPNHIYFDQKFAGDPYRGTTTEVYTLGAVVLIPKDRIRRALQFDKDITDAIINLKGLSSSTSDSLEWELPICLKDFPVEADYPHLLEILDTSVSRENFKIWEEVMEILCRSKTVDEIGTSRIFTSVEKFPFEKVQPFLDTLVTQLTAVDDISSFIDGIKKASSKQDQKEAREWCSSQGDGRIMRILGSNEKTLPSLVQYGFVKGLRLLSDFTKSLSEDKRVGFTFWLLLVGHLDRQWQSVDSSSLTGAPLRELHLVLDCCIAAMTPLASEGAVYFPVAQDLIDDLHHNAEVHVRRIVIVIEICLRFSSARCGEVLSEVFSIPGDIHIKFDLFLRPLARNLRSLLGQYDFPIFRQPFFLFYRLLVGMYLGFCLGGEPTQRGQPTLARILCTKKVVCNNCQNIQDFLSSRDESRELLITNKEWKHLRYVIPKLKDEIFPPIVTSGGLRKTIRINKRRRSRANASKEFLEVIGDEEEISRLMEPFDEEVRKALNDEEAFDFELCLQLPVPPSPSGSRSARSP